MASAKFCTHPYKYDSEDSNPPTEEARSASERGSVESDTRVRFDDSTKKSKKKKSKSKSRDPPPPSSDEEEEVEQEEKRKHRSGSKKKSRAPARRYQDTDVESGGEDNSCVKMSVHFINIIQKTINDETPRALMDTLRKTPVAVVLHYAHFIFYLVRDNDRFFDIMKDYNRKYNIVSRYFLKALQDEDRTRKVMKMLVDVTDQINKNVPLDEIKDLLHFTPEFIVMITIQSGNIEMCDNIISEWELNEKFTTVMDLIAAFFGIKKFFTDTSRFDDRRDLLISCICGGSVKTLAKIMRKTKSEYLTEYTLRKTRGLCIPNSEITTYIYEKYGLEFC